VERLREVVEERAPGKVTGDAGLGQEGAIVGKPSIVRLATIVAVGG
jgi:hypothetical protein